MLQAFQIVTPLSTLLKVAESGFVIACRALASLDVIDCFGLYHNLPPACWPWTSRPACAWRGTGVSLTAPMLFGEGVHPLSAADLICRVEREQAFASPSPSKVSTFSRFRTQVILQLA
jgi:hypothetical protein